MENLILIVALALVLGGAVLYIVRSKRKGRKCIGCPVSCNCSGNCSGCDAGRHKTP